MHKNSLISLAALGACSMLLLAVPTKLQFIVKAVENQDSVTTRTTERIELNKEMPIEKKQEIPWKKTEVKEKLQLRKDEVKQNRCEMTQTKVKTQLEKFDDFKSERDGRATAFDHRLEIVLSKLRERKIDVTTLEKDRELLKSYEAELSTALGTYADLVEQAHQLAPRCESDATAFKEALQATRTQMVEVRSAAEKVRIFSKTQLRGDLLSAQKQLNTQKKVSIEK